MCADAVKPTDLCHIDHRYLAEEEHGSASKETRSQMLLAQLQQKAKEKQSLTERPANGLTALKQERRKRKSESRGEPPQQKRSNTEASDTNKLVEKKKKKTDESGVCYH